MSVREFRQRRIFARLTLVKRKSRGHRTARDFVRESASSYEVSTGDDEAVVRTQAPSRFALGAGFNERTGQPPTKKESRTFVLLSVGGEPTWS